MVLKFEKEVKDVRGKIIFLTNDGFQIHVVEIKKGFSRGGHYHKNPTSHFLISGKIEYMEENVKTEIGKSMVINAPTNIPVAANVAHLLTALEDCIFLEFFHGKYEATYYPKYRQIVEEKMKSSSEKN